MAALEQKCRRLIDAIFIRPSKMIRFFANNNFLFNRECIRTGFIGLCYQDAEGEIDKRERERERGREKGGSGFIKMRNEHPVKDESAREP